MLRVATFGLIERDVLRVRDYEVFVTEGGPAVTHPLEGALVEAYRQNRGAAFRDLRVRELADRYVDRLIEMGAWTTGARARLEMMIRGLVLALLMGVAAMKIGLAISRGRTNIFILIILSVAGSTAAYMYRKHRRTQRGEDFLNHVRGLLSHSLSAATSQELVMVAAVMGGIGLPAIARSYASEIFPAWKPTWSERFASMQNKTSNNSCGSAGGCGGGGGEGGCGGCSSS